MTIEEIVSSLEDQVRDKDALAGGDPDSIFTRDATVLTEAARLLRTYHEKMEKGLLVELPCRRDDVIYQLRRKKHAKGRGVSPRVVSCITVWNNPNDFWGIHYEINHQGMTECRQEDLGKKWFLTKEEAEAALSQQIGGDYAT